MHGMVMRKLLYGSSLSGVALALALSAPLAQAQAQPPAPRAAAPTTAPLSASTPWRSLSPAQKEALRPLAGKWHELPEDRKRKWIEISRNYHSLPPVEQAKLHSRMTEWVALSQQQRTQARLNYVEAQKLPVDEKAAKWQAYQELSTEEKRRLADRAPVKSTGAAVPKSAGAEKLTPVPVTRRTPKPSDAPTPALPIHANTLLPQPAGTLAADPQPQ